MSEQLIDYWTVIQNRLTNTSGLKRPDNTIATILKEMTNGFYNEFTEDIYNTVLETFLLTADSSYLDIKGKELNIQRTSEESDNDYRQRLFNAISTVLNVNFIKKQGIIVYTKKEKEDNIRQKMTSNNPYINNTYAIFPKTSTSSFFISTDFIYEYVTTYYMKGWD